jgi:hypothetical protein
MEWFSVLRRISFTGDANLLKRIRGVLTRLSESVA